MSVSMSMCMCMCHACRCFEAGAEASRSERGGVRKQSERGVGALCLFRCIGIHDLISSSKALKPHVSPHRSFIHSESTVVLPHAPEPHTHVQISRHNPPRDRTDTDGMCNASGSSDTLVPSHTVLFPLVHSPLPIRTLSNTPLSSVAVRSVLAIGRPPSSQLTARCFEARADSSIDVIHAHKKAPFPPLDRRALRGARGGGGRAARARAAWSGCRPSP